MSGLKVPIWYTTGGSTVLAATVGYTTGMGLQVQPIRQMHSQQENNGKQCTIIWTH